ncbi:MAG: AAA family ATPase [Bdellovibrionaceae bacterium]|nr:AAA family ATPase [Pseudobdellovibrionaceae bacterium]
MSLENARKYLLKIPGAIEGMKGEETTFKVCCLLVNDFNLSSEETLNLLCEDWNNRCSPPWEKDELLEKIHNAKEYSTGRPGSKSKKHNKSSPKKEIVTRRLSDIESRELEYIDEPYILRGMLTLLSGDPGVSKSTLVREIAKNVSVGKSSLTTNEIDIGDVLYLTNEDSPEYVIRPRMEKIGADLSRIVLCEDSLTFDPESQVLIKKAIQENNICLLIVDPIIAYIGATKSANEATHVRETMSFLSNLARDCNIAVICIRHLNKSTIGGPAIYRGLGSIDFTAACRNEFHVYIHPDEKDMRLLFHVKTNVSALLEPLEYELVDGGAKNFRVSNMTIQDITSLSHRTHSKLEDAEEFLRSFIEANGGKAKSNELEIEAKKQGISQTTLKRARKKLCVSDQESSPYGNFWVVTLRTQEATSSDHIDEPQGTSGV